MPPPDGASIQVAIIPFFGIQLQFRGEPSDGEKFAAQIMNAILAKSLRLPCEVIVLFVDRQNERARCFYKKFFFNEFAPLGGNNIQMHRPIRRAEG
jgi:hypothetical protein